MYLRVSTSAMLCLFLTAAAPAADPEAGSVLHLNNGGSVVGELRGSRDPTVLRWHSPGFAQPLEFPLSAVSAVYYTVPGAPPKPRGEYCFEMIGDDLLYGDVLGVTNDEVEVNSVRLGHVHLRRNQIRRFYRWKGADLIYFGPNGLAGWKEPAAKPQWRDDGGQLVTDQAGASLFGDLGIPEKAVIDVQFSWKRTPNFVLALGVDDRDWTDPHAFRFEVWDGDLVVVGESARDADVASVQPLGAGAGQIRLRAYLDQAQRRLLLVSGDGKPLAALHLNGKNAPIRSGVRLTNTKGDLRLEQLRITRWNGLLPGEAPADKSRLQRTDGSVVYGRLTAYDPESKELTVRDGATETLVKQEAVADVFLAPALLVTETLTDTPAELSKPMLRLVFSDGSRVSGTLTRIEDAHVTLSGHGVVESLRLPLVGLRSLLVLRSGEGPRAPLATGRPGRLEMDGVSLKGRLVDGGPLPKSSCLVWHPDLGLNASPLVAEASGRIVYRELPRTSPSTSAIRRTQTARGVVMQRIVRPNGAVVIQQMVPGGGLAPMNGLPVHRLPSSGRRALHLRSGDAIPCEVSRIDEKGVTIKTPFSDATVVAHDKIKSVELISNYSAVGIDEAKRNRLLTLPRMQKNSPPTQLICSKNGDFLRGRLLEMDERRLKVEVHSETKEIPRDRVAQIIWLHPDELTGKPTAAAGDHSQANRVQIVRADGDRLTFVAEKVDHKTIWGKSAIFGPCRIDLVEVDQLLFGTFIEESAAKLAYQLWKLHYATEPKFAQDDANAAAKGEMTGTESPLVGQQAFPFQLAMLDGSRFRLGAHKGHVVVLDFWASWCGPCMQSMPLVDEVVRRFADRKVELVAVNMEEQPEQVKTMLQRHQLKVPVVFDADGTVAAKYAVTAIPQTVVIDRDGKIARLFVGGGKKTAEALRKALEELAGGK
jgi:thiol-disulfide isomerase/thioredoxin